MEVFTDDGAPVKSWAVDLEAGAREQIINVSRLPFIVGTVALMPDAHQGYGMPIGGTFMAADAVVPNAIGVDIGCGVSLIETGLKAADLAAEDVKAFLAQVARDVPVGNGPQAEHREAAPFAWEGEIPDHMEPILARGERQLGTLGGGNHFLELQRGEDDGLVYFMIHSGSRSVGKKTCDHYHKIALELNRLWHSALPHDELAWLPFRSDEGANYWADMNLALTWAEENRLRMSAKVIDAFESVLGVDHAVQTLDIHHNYAAFEHHRGRNGIVHRKGAVRAQAGETVLIPGSMSTGSYIARGMGNADSFDTCQHGAGRARSRAATRKMLNLEEMEALLTDAGVQLVTPKRAAVIDEAAPAYKDIESVMAASTDLVEPVQRLAPIGVVKG